VAAVLRANLSPPQVAVATREPLPATHKALPHLWAVHTSILSVVLNRGKLLHLRKRDPGLGSNLNIQHFVEQLAMWMTLATLRS
jgi:hypothetical protein